MSLNIKSHDLFEWAMLPLKFRKARKRRQYFIDVYDIFNMMKPGSVNRNESHGNI